MLFYAYAVDRISTSLPINLIRSELLEFVTLLFKQVVFKTRVNSG